MVSTSGPLVANRVQDILSCAAVLRNPHHSGPHMVLCIIYICDDLTPQCFLGPGKETALAKNFDVDIHGRRPVATHEGGFDIFRFYVFSPHGVADTALKAHRAETKRAVRFADR